MFECIEVSEQVYEWLTPSKITNHRAYANHASHGRKRKVDRADSSINSEKIHAGNIKKIIQGSRKYIQAIQAIVWSTLWMSVNDLGNTSKIMPHIVTKNKLDPASKKKHGEPVNLNG